MCEALYDLFANELKMREERTFTLIMKLISENRNEDIQKAATDAPYREALIKQYGL